MRQVGYGEKQGRRGQTSFTRRLQSGRFPRYHAYVEETNGGLQINLHLDQQAGSHEGQTAHKGEYSGPLVAQELDRIGRNVKQMKEEGVQGMQTAKPPSQTQSKKSSDKDDESGSKYW
jgi:hypothetical protein